MADVIRVTGMRFYSCHGVLPRERSLAQTFEVDVEIGTDVRRAQRTDALADTVNYAEAAAVVQAVLEGPPRALLERLAGDIADGLLALGGAKWVRVRVRKMNPPIGLPASWAEVEVEREA